MTTTTKLDIDRLRTLFELQSADVEVERRNGKWVVVKGGAELIGVRSEKTRVWRDLDRCVETLEEAGAKHITIKVAAAA